MTEFGFTAIDPADLTPEAFAEIIPHVEAGLAKVDCVVAGQPHTLTSDGIRDLRGRYPGRPSLGDSEAFQTLQAAEGPIEVIMSPGEPHQVHQAIAV